MESSDKVLLFFPTPVYVCDNLLSTEENRRMSDRAIELSKKVACGGTNWNCNTINSLGTFDLRSDPIFDNLNSIVYEKVKKFAEFLGSDYEYKINEAWYNVSLEGSFQEGHIHPRHNFSCIYYSSTPPGSGKLILYNGESEMVPLHNTQNNDFNSVLQKFTPTEGTLVIFRSFVRHMVTLGENKEPRVSLAYNFN